MINMISMGLVMSIKVHTEENEDILGSAEQPSITDTGIRLVALQSGGFSFV